MWHLIFLNLEYLVSQPLSSCLTLSYAFFVEPCDRGFLPNFRSKACQGNQVFSVGFWPYAIIGWQLRVWAASREILQNVFLSLSKARKIKDNKWRRREKKVTGHFAPITKPPQGSHLMRFKCNIPRSLSHKAKQACFECNIPRSLSHNPKQARFKYNIPRFRIGGEIRLGGEMTCNREKRARPSNAEKSIVLCFFVLD